MRASGALLARSRPDCHQFPVLLDRLLHGLPREGQVEPDQLTPRPYSGGQQPDETHRGGRGEYHALKRIDVSHFMVVIYDLWEGGGLIRTAFMINEKRKERRYKER